MGRGGDQVVFRGVNVSVGCSVEVVWAPSRGVKVGIGTYSLRVVGRIYSVRVEGRAEVRVRDAITLVSGGVGSKRERRGVERGSRQVVVVVGPVGVGLGVLFLLTLCQCGSGRRELGGTSGAGAVVEVVEVGMSIGQSWRRGCRSYRQAGVPAKILLFSIASVHGGPNITPAGQNSGSPWRVSVCVCVCGCVCGWVGGCVCWLMPGDKQLETGDWGRGGGRGGSVVVGGPGQDWRRYAEYPPTRPQHETRQSVHGYVTGNSDRRSL